jgi:hypothetical protein
LAPVSLKLQGRAHLIELLPLYATNRNSFG